MSDIDDLLAYIFEGKKGVLAAEFTGWLRDSRRFKAFATTYRDKIRAKLRNARDADGLRDVQAELFVAAALLGEERFTLEYETYIASKQRGPDFTVKFKTHTPFNVEVRRVRGLEADDEADARMGKLIGVVCDKVGQMPAGIVNWLWLMSDVPIAEDDLLSMGLLLRQLAERKVELFFTGRGFESAAEFLKQYQRLSGIIAAAEGGSVLWLNPVARQKTPPEIVTALGRFQAGR